MLEAAGGCASVRLLRPGVATAAPRVIQLEPHEPVGNGLHRRHLRLWIPAKLPIVVPAPTLHFRVCHRDSVMQFVHGDRIAVTTNDNCDASRRGGTRRYLPATPLCLCEHRLQYQQRTSRAPGLETISRATPARRRGRMRPSSSGFGRYIASRARSTRGWGRRRAAGM